MANIIRIRRRDLLLGGAGLALLAPVMRATMAHAEPQPATRLITLFTPNGLNYLQAEPKATASGFELGPYYAPLEAHKADMIALTGMHIGGIPYGQNTETGHRSGGMGCLTNTPDELTGYATGPSIDQFVARKLNEQGVVPYIKAPVFSVATSGVSSYAHTYFESKGVPVPLVNDPAVAFEGLFQELVDGMGQDISVILARKKSVLDAAWDDCKAFVSELPSEGKTMLDYHCTRIRELEKNLESIYNTICTPPEAALDAVSGLDVSDPNNYPALTDFFWDLMEVALSCDLTRVVSFSFGNTAKRFNMPWLDPPVIATVDTGETNVKDHHSHTHAGTFDSVKLFMNWYATKIAELVTRLKKEQPDGTRLIDSTLTYLTTEYGAGGPHLNENVPMFLFGNANGAFSTGRLLDFDNDAAHTHALFVSMIQALGITGVDQFGHPGGGSGPLDALKG